jgi:hypothetical protein
LLFVGVVASWVDLDIMIFWVIVQSVLDLDRVSLCTWETAVRDSEQVVIPSHVHYFVLGVVTYLLREYLGPCMQLTKIHNS